MERQITLEQVLQVWRDRIIAQETAQTHIAMSALYELATQQLSSAEAEAVLAHLYHCLSCRVEWHALLRELTVDASPSAPPWYGGSTEPLTDFVSLDRLAAAAEIGATRARLFRSQDGLVTATVRLTADGLIAVALETQDPQHATRQWGFRFSRADGTELYSATMTLQPTEQPGLWEGRLEIDLILTEPWRFAFYALPHDGGDMP